MSGSNFHNVLLVGLALALLVTGSWLLLGPGAAPPDLDRVVVYPPDPARPRPGVHIEAAAGDPTGAAACEVAVTLQTVARTLPVAAERPTCELVATPDAPVGSGVAGTWIAGLAALPLARRLHGQQLVHFRLADGRDHYRITRLRPDDRGVIRLLRGPLVVSRGQVVDEGGQPVAGARVWLAGFTTTTDAEGRFTVDALPADAGLPLVVRKSGFASLYQVLSGERYAGLAERPLVLRRGVALHVRFTGELPAAAGRVFLLPAGGRDSRLLGFPFFLAAIEPLHTRRDGMLVFEGLPTGARVRVRLLRPGCAPATSAEVRLAQPVVSAVVPGAVRARISGAVVDADGRPAADVWLTSRAGAAGLSLEHTDWLLPPAAYVTDGDVVRTATDGTFELARLADTRRRTVVALEAVGHIGLAYDLVGAGDRQLRLRLFPNRPQTAPRVVLRAGPGLPARARLQVLDGTANHGPYPWSTAQPFPLRIDRRAVLRVQVRVADREPVVHDDLLVVGDTVVTVDR